MGKMPSNEYVNKILNQIKDGKYNRKELENLYANAEKKGISQIQEAVQQTLNNFGNVKINTDVPIKLATIGSQSVKSIAIVGNFNVEKYDLTYQKFCAQLEFLYQDGRITFDTIISGGAKGVDTFAKQFANDNGLKYIEFLPDWKQYGRAAGPIRNKLIVEECDKLIAFWDYNSSGTKSSVKFAEKSNKLLRIIELKPH